MKNKEDLGIISFFYNCNYFYNCIVSSNKAKIYKINFKYLTDILSTEKKCIYKMAIRVKERIKLLLERLIFINNIKISMIDIKVTDKKKAFNLENSIEYKDSMNKTLLKFPKFNSNMQKFGEMLKKIPKNIETNKLNLDGNNTSNNNKLDFPSINKINKISNINKNINLKLYNNRLLLNKNKNIPKEINTNTKMTKSNSFISYFTKYIGTKESLSFFKETQNFFSNKSNNIKRKLLYRTTDCKFNNISSCSLSVKKNENSNNLNDISNISIIKKNGNDNSCSILPSNKSKKKNKKINHPYYSPSVLLKKQKYNFCYFDKDNLNSKTNTVKRKQKIHRLDLIIQKQIP